MEVNLRHLRAFLSVAQTGSITRAAELCHISQPAVTQAIAKLETEAGQPLFTRTPQGLFATEAGQVLHHRTARAMTPLDTHLHEIAPRLVLTATRAQLQALIAAAEVQNFSLAARRLGIAQPTVHRAITQLEREAGRALFQRSPLGIAPTRAASALARIARLAFVELDQARAELGDLLGREVGQVVLGAMPLSRSYILPKALASFRATRPSLTVKVLEGSYDELLAGLRRGEIDILTGALRDPAPIGDVVQERLFDDTLVLLAGKGHPLAGRPLPPLASLLEWPWLVTREGTPTRTLFDRYFKSSGLTPPQGVIETGSVILMREMVQDNRHLACMSYVQAQSEVATGLVKVLAHDFGTTRRAIGLTMRADWQPTPAQAKMLSCLRSIGGRI
ncbi:LysR family transcriptional regulator (plasmid) [Thioclava sp. 'Guangxiensis']|uniref:LysR family transcriptional regulator n=1 Tax=Thioclava sp. 'Guangxiensis' TaxID=3149044 RepID=UPI0032C40BEE